MDMTMEAAATNLTAASELAKRYWQENRALEKRVFELERELIERDARAEQYIEVRRGTAIFRDRRWMP